MICVSNSSEAGDCDDPQVYESMCNIQTGSCESPHNSELGNTKLPVSPLNSVSMETLHSLLSPLSADWCSTLWCCDVSDVPPQSAVVSQESKEENIEEDIYEYDCPRPVALPAPPAPSRRPLADISGPTAAFSALSIDSSLETSRFLTSSHACGSDPHSLTFRFLLRNMTPL